jgi:hypothetical protein
MADWFDVGHFNPTTWLGEPPPLTSVTAQTPYPPNFASDFNSYGPKAIERVVAAKLIPSTEPHFVAPFLLYADGVRQAAITQYFFLNPAEAQSLIYSYFSAANVDYLSLPGALRLLLSRVALPEDSKRLFAIFGAVAEVYYESNQYICESRDEILKLTIACVILSMSKRKSNILLEKRFRKLVEQVRCPDDYKLILYDSVRKAPIPLYFTAIHFQTDPDPVKRGMMLRIRKRFGKEKVYWMMSDISLNIYKDNQYIVLLEEIPLYNTTIQLTAAKDKDRAKILIANRDGLPLGSSFKKGVRSPAKKSLYEFTGPKEKAELWMGYLNFTALYVNLIQMMNCSPGFD